MLPSLPVYCGWVAFINSTPGHKGGYVLAKPANEIGIKNVLIVLGGALFSKEFCAMHSGALKLCTELCGLSLLVPFGR
jgi:DNA-binding IscR family transcriptional regulator